MKVMSFDARFVKSCNGDDSIRLLQNIRSTQTHGNFKVRCMKMLVIGKHQKSGTPYRSDGGRAALIDQTKPQNCTKYYINNGWKTQR